MGWVHKLRSNPQNVVFALVRNPEKCTELQDMVNSRTEAEAVMHVLQMDLDDLKSIRVSILLCLTTRLKEGVRTNFREGCS